MSRPSKSDSGASVPAMTDGAPLSLSSPSSPSSFVAFDDLAPLSPLIFVDVDDVVPLSLPPPFPSASASA